MPRRSLFYVKIIFIMGVVTFVNSTSYPHYDNSYKLPYQAIARQEINFFPRKVTQI